MKRNLLVLFSIFIWQSIFPQFHEYKFEWDNPWTNPNCNPYFSQNANTKSYWGFNSSNLYRWKNSHGSPTIPNKNYSNADFSAQLVNNVEKSEGLYIEYPFQAGYYYNVYVTGRRTTTATVGMDILAANNLTIKGDNCALGDIPVSASKLIHYNISVPQPYLGAYTSWGNSNWLATDNYGLVWVRSRYSDPSLIGTFRLSGIVIIKGSAETEPPTTPSNLALVSETHNSFKISWTPSTDNSKMSHYEVYLDGVLKGNTANNNYTFTGLTSNQVYSARVKAVDVVNNKSPLSEPLLVLIVPTTTISGENSPLCNSNSRNFSTVSYSNATYFWEVSQGLTLNNNGSNNTNVTGNSGFQGNVWIKVTRTITQNGIQKSTNSMLTFWVGAPLTPNYISPFTGGGYIVGGNTQYSISTNGAGGTSWDWQVTNGTILSGQGQSDAILKTDICHPDYNLDFYLSVSAHNSCGNSGYFTFYSYIPAGDPNGGENQTGPGLNDPGNSLGSSGNAGIEFQEEGDFEFRVFPNPTVGIINLTLPINVVDIKVYDLSGKLLRTDIIENGKNTHTMNLSELKGGIYLLVVKKSDGLQFATRINLTQ